MKTAKEILSELTGIHEYRMNDDKGEYVTKSGALEAMERYAEQFKISSSPVLSEVSPPSEQYPDNEADGIVFCGKCGKQK